MDESEMMAKALVGMTMSLDGFVQDRHGRIDRLHPNLAALQTETLQELIRATGAVVMGRRVYDGNAHHGALGASKPSRHS